MKTVIDNNVILDIFQNRENFYNELKQYLK